MRAFSGSRERRDAGATGVALNLLIARRKEFDDYQTYYCRAPDKGN